MSLTKVQLLSFPKINDRRGDLSVVESLTHIPFEIKRIFYLYNITDSETRGAHAHKELEQIFIAISGRFKVTVDDGFNKKTFLLYNPWEGLYVPSMVWNTLSLFSPAAVCLVLASDFFKEEDYHRNYKEFIKDVTYSK